MNIMSTHQNYTLKEIVILIPAFNPDYTLVDLTKDLIKSGFEQIIIVNDGSKQELVAIFSELRKEKQCQVLNHDSNMGKGAALKTGFGYIIDNIKNCYGVITVDADGQHRISDIIKVAQKMSLTPEKLILGTRNFSGMNIPARSRFGNELTRRIFSFLTGIKVKDTQTGLRAIPFKFLTDLTHVHGKRYEYEMNMLLECKQQDIEIEQVDIETVYINENQSSHFNPLLDSIRIYALLLKYLFSSLFSFVLDIILFTILIDLIQEISPKYYILLSTIGARIVSSLFNFFLNKNAVFHRKSNDKAYFIRYYILCIAQLLVSGLIVTAVNLLLSNTESLIKIIVDSLLWIISFKLQKEWVFRKTP